MSIEVSNKTKIYIACRANYMSGGSETLHQIAYHLRKDLGIHAFMYYYDSEINKNNDPVYQDYKIYEIPYVLEISSIDDNPQNILLVNESLSGLNLLKNYKNIRKGVVFLSVDNYYFEKLLQHNDIFFQRATYAYSLKENTLEYLVKKYDYKEDHLLKLADFYILQCYRAMEWFKELKPQFYLPKFINNKFLNTEIDISKKEDIVAYNPSKGIFFTTKIISIAKDIKFIPLINMTREEIIETLQKAKVYIDFGNHPGIDRFPREAALLGCCVITNKKGTAGYYKDLPIPDEYKFHDIEENITKIVDKIRHCLINYQEKYKDFDHYRKIIRESPEKFLNNLRNIFVKTDRI